MNTHILIPIKDIQKRLRHLDNERLKFKSKGGADYDFYDGRVCELRELLTEPVGKQISLDEKDIEEKAELFNSTHKTNQKYGYKQALKDLL